MLYSILKDKSYNILNNIVDAFDAGLSILDKDLNILWVNNTLLNVLNLKYDPVGKNCRDVYKCECKDTKNCSTFQALSSGEKQFSEIKHITGKGERRYIQNITTPIKDEKNNITHFLKISLDVTDKEEKIYQLSLLRKLAELMQGKLPVDRLLHLILTCVTAGPALGFNRARLFMVDKKRNAVYGRMAVGPSSWEEVNKIWTETSKKYETFEDLGKAVDDDYSLNTPLDMVTRLMAYSLTDEKEVLVLCIKTKNIILERNAFNNPKINKKFVSMIDANEFVCVPLVVENEAIGVICADNIYSHKPITEERVELLSIFASRAAMAIANAEAYKELQEKVRQLKHTQGRLVRSERLAVIGNMASYLAHEIRNPLVNIGGFASSIMRAPNKDDQIRQNAEIIVEEVSRLEKILANIMNFSKPAEPVKLPTQINELLESTCFFMDSYFIENRIQVVKRFGDMIPEITVDPTQIKQVLLNMINNAVESMSGGGTLTVETMVENDYVKINITDTGIGMTAEITQNIFTPFFTTKAEGTGVGLAVSHKIVDDHGGSIEVKSSLQEGSTFSIYLPITQWNG